MPLTRPRVFLLSAALCAAPALLLLADPSWVPWPGGQAAPWLKGLEVLLLLWALAALRLNQTRLALLSLGLGASLHSTQPGTLWPPLPAGLSLADAWSLCAPLGLALCLLPRQGKLFSARSAASLGLMALPALVLWAAWVGDPAEVQHLLSLRLPGLAYPHWPSPWGLASVLLGMVLLWKRHHAKTEAVTVVLSGALLGQVLLAWTLHLAQPSANAWLMSQGILILGLSLALYYLYWQRVYLDELTGIPNRRALDEKLAHLDGAYSLAMVDIDHFKRFNDDYGHDQGDDVLRLVGGHFAEGSGGRAYRYGGEEFCVLFEGLDSEQASQEADALRAALERRRFHIRLPKTLRKGDGPKQRGHSVATAQVKVTVSVGVAQKDKKHPEVNQVMKLADQGLYKAKAAGRNNVQAMN